ncbi:MAG: transposase [candidate division Zixibacteria bacterium]|nr:transposase [candidate division Zixibacteria bacterium]
MSWVRVWVHLVFSTKNKEPFLQTGEIRKKMFQHIKQNAEAKGIWLDCINGYHDHAHCLISLNKDQTTSKVAQLIKGESSFWINQAKLIDTKFIWQDDYWAVSVSDYILKQEERHIKKSFTDEVNEFMEKYGWTLIRQK